MLREQDRAGVLPSRPCANTSVHFPRRENRCRSGLHRPVCGGSTRPSCRGRVATIAAMQPSLKPQRCLRTAFKAAPWRATILRLESERARGFQAKDVLHRLGEGGLFITGLPSYGWQAVFYTYVIESLSHPDQRYIGHTADLRQRLVDHNARNCPILPSLSRGSSRFMSRSRRLNKLNISSST